VRLAAGLDGLVHISALSEERVEAVEDVVKKGQKVQVRILSVDRDAKRLELTMKAGGSAHGGRQAKQSSAGTSSLGTFADLFAKAKK
jgi:ribosomal protein S1